MKIIGLTGGIGMGKSFAAGVFRRAGIAVFDSDAAVHRLQAPHGAALPAIERYFPGVVTDGVLDRAALRRAVLADRGALRKLEAILHPLVRAAQAKFVASARGRGASCVVLDVPLLFETGGDRKMDRILVVSAPASVQRARVRARRKMTDEEIDRMIALQMPDSQKRARADIIIKTGLSRHHTQAAIRRNLPLK